VPCERRPVGALISISLITVGAALTRQADTFVYSCGALRSGRPATDVDKSEPPDSQENPFWSESPVPERSDAIIRAQ
jgi:hypothetical protein